MVSNNIKEKKAAKLAQEKLQDVKLYRMMIELGLAMIAIFLAIAAGNNPIFTLQYVITPFLAVSAILFALSAIFFTVKRKQNADESYCIFTSTAIFGNAAALCALSALYYIYSDVKLVLAALITLTVLYFVYNIYGGNFFAYSAITAAGFLALQIMSLGSNFHAISGLIFLASEALAFIIPIAAIVLAAVLFVSKKNRRIFTITVGGKKSAAVLFVSAAAILAGAVLLLVYPAAVIFAEFALLGFYLVVAVVCTVKMM